MSIEAAATPISNIVLPRRHWTYADYSQLDDDQRYEIFSRRINHDPRA